VPTAASRLEACTERQRELLDLIAREGSVANAARALGTTRSSVYAALRRIAHRAGLRDSGDLLRLIDVR
jgi:DNA-binding CsgD family transcriptional regulator